MIDKAAPYIGKIRVQKFDPRRIGVEMREFGGDLIRLAKDIPSDIREIMTQVKQGRIKLGFEHRGLENFISGMDRSSNRISFALIISSLIIGSSMIITAGIGPLIFGWPLIGVLGFCIAGVFGLWLVISILRSGRL